MCTDSKKDNGNTARDIDIKLVQTGGWEALYVNSVKYAEGNSIDSEDWFKLGQKYPKLNYNNIEFGLEVDMEIIYKEGYFPEKFDDISKKYFI